RLNRYGRNESDGFDLNSYEVIEEDLNGYPLTTIYYSSAGQVSDARYTERDANGNIIRDGYSYAPGADGIWATSDDFTNYGLSFFNMNGDLVAQGDERIGADGEWGTEDDTITISWLYLLEYDVDVLALNVGEFTDTCGSLLSGIGASTSTSY